VAASPRQRRLQRWCRGNARRLHVATSCLQQRQEREMETCRIEIGGFYWHLLGADKWAPHYYIRSTPSAEEYSHDKNISKVNFTMTNDISFSIINDVYSETIEKISPTND
jgi:hypothetical protein